MEPEGRDRDFIAALKEELSPGASSFEEAVRQVGTAQLVRAVFRRVALFAEMFVDIVEFFTTAGTGAIIGRSSWMARSSNSPILGSFQKRWQQIEGMLVVPVAGLGSCGRYARRC
jgi:hypothetical protein